jgi:tetratricopeptide (TPR) repeat protein
MAKNLDQNVVAEEVKPSSQNENFFDKYRKAITYVSAALVLVLGSYFAYEYAYAKPRNHEAEVAFWKAYNYFMIDSTEWALNGKDDALGFESIIAQYDGTPAAELSHYCAAIIYRDKGDFGAALSHFEQVNVDDQAVSVYVTGNIGDMHVEMGNLDEGVKHFEKAAAASKANGTRDYLAGEYYLKAARVYMEQNNKDKAKETLEKALEGADKRAAFYGEAEKLLNMLKAQG